MCKLYANLLSNIFKNDLCKDSLIHKFWYYSSFYIFFETIANDNCLNPRYWEFSISGASFVNQTVPIWFELDWNKFCYNGAWNPILVLQHNVSFPPTLAKMATYDNCENSKYLWKTQSYFRISKFLIHSWHWNHQNIRGLFF